MEIALFLLAACGIVGFITLVRSLAKAIELFDEQADWDR